MRKTIAIFIFLLGAGSASAYYNDAQAYILYNKANELYRNKDLAQAKSVYLQLVKDQGESKYVPYALYMLSFIETDYLKIIDYLNLIKDGYQSFKYWPNAVEKLGDIYYVVGNYAAASQVYKLAKTDKSFYMLSVIYSADGYQKDAIAYTKYLLEQTKDKALAYKGMLVQAKALVELRQYTAALDVCQKAIKLKPAAFDNGARVLYYAGKSLFYKKEMGKALYVFSLLRTTFPLSAESSLAKNYLEYLGKNSVVVAEPVDWVEYYFASPAEVAFKTENVGLDYEAEKKAEEMALQAEDIAGKVVKSVVEEYVVRIGEFKDLGVANLVAVDLSRPEYRYPIGIYFRNGVYYAEIRGVKELEKAKDYATKLIAMGYNDTKVVEVVKVTKYGQ